MKVKIIAFVLIGMLFLGGCELDSEPILNQGTMAIPCPNCEVLLPETQGEIKECDVCGEPIDNIKG